VIDASRHAIAVLRASHDHLTGLLAGLDDEVVRGPSFDDEWSIAQVCSHLGSGAEINLDWARAAVEHREPLTQEGIEAIWARWDSMTPREQVDGVVVADEAHVAALESFTDEEIAGAHLSLFGGYFVLDGSTLARFRLGEHAVHTWDIAVALDPTAELLDATVELLVDGMPGSVPRLGEHQGRAWALTVRTTDPVRDFVLRSAADGVTLAPGGGVTDGTVELPAEQLVRLCYCRLRDGEVVPVASGSTTADELRATFPPH
jgi:uncharacterized protein (TIGR03083 family)